MGFSFEPELKNFRIEQINSHDYLTLIDQKKTYDESTYLTLIPRVKYYKIVLIDFEKQYLELHDYFGKQFSFKLKNIQYPIRFYNYVSTRTVIVGNIPPKNKWQWFKISFWKRIKRFFN